MQVNSTRFGTLEVADDAIIKMARGILGFESYSEYCLIQHRPDTAFRWLQSTEEASLAFVVVEPTAFFNDYEFEVPDADAEKLDITKVEDVLALMIVTIGKNGQETTANLAAPLIINTTNLKAMQVVLQDTRYGIKQPLVSTEIKLNSKETKQTDKEKVMLKAA